MKKTTKNNVPLSHLIAHRIKHDEQTCFITLDGEKIGEWNDYAICDYPEDVCWHRDIGSLFREAFEAGYNYAVKTREKK
jgi:hypothetical protein